MKNIILFYQHVNREKNACLNLKIELEKNNDNKVHIFSIDFQLHNAVKLCRRVKIDMIIMPWMYHDLNYELIQPLLSTNENMIIVNLHHEQIGSEVTYKILLPNGENAKNSVIHFVWGDFFEEKLINSGVNRNLIFKTGNIRTDSVYKNINNINNRSIFSQEFNLDINKKWILFCDNRGWVLTINKLKENDMLYMGYTEADIEEYKEVTKKSLELTMKEFNDLKDDFFNKYEIIYRPHPGSKAPANINSRVKVIDRYSIYEWLNVIDINLVWSSTTIFESDIKNIPSFVHEPIENPHKFKTVGVELYPKITKILEIDDIKMDEVKKDLAEKKIYESYLGLVDGKSADRAALTINRLLNMECRNYKAKLELYSKYMYYRKMIFEIVSILFYKLSILQILKYPKSAYEQITDIPTKQ